MCVGADAPGARPGVHSRAPRREKTGAELRGVRELGQLLQKVQEV